MFINVTKQLWCYFAELIEMQSLITDAGIFGSITGVAATFGAFFVIFGAFIEITKTGQFFTDLACTPFFIIAITEDNAGEISA